MTQGSTGNKMPDETHTDWSCAADFLDEIEVDKNGKCHWADVANAQTHIRMALRSVRHDPALPSLVAALERIASLGGALCSARGYRAIEIARDALAEYRGEVK